MDYRPDGKRTLKSPELATRLLDTIAITSETSAQRVDLVEQIERERYARRVQFQISRQSLGGHGSTQTSTAEPPFLDARALRLECAFFDPTGHILTRCTRDAAQFNQRELDVFLDDLALKISRLVIAHDGSPVKMRTWIEVERLAHRDVGGFFGVRVSGRKHNTQHDVEIARRVAGNTSAPEPQAPAGC